MKNNKLIFTALIIILVLNIILLNKISDLDKKVSVFSSRISALENSLHNTVTSVRASVSDELQKTYALITDYNYKYGEADINKGTVFVTITVIPKEYSLNTNAFLVSDDNEYPMCQENGTFKTELELSIYDEFSVDFVKFVTGDEVNNEKISINISPRYDFLPVMFAKYHGRCTSVKKKDSYEATYNGQITVNLERKSFPVNAQKIEMVEYIDGEEIKRTNVPLNTQPFAVQSGDGSYSVAEEAVTPYDSEWRGSKVFYYQLEDKKITIPYGSVYEIYIEVADNIGLLHRMCADTREISESGMPVDRVSVYADGASIYNAETGELLYQ